MKRLFELSFGYARELNPGDEYAAQALCESCNDVYERLTGLSAPADAGRKIIAESIETSNIGTFGLCIGVYGRTDQLIGVLAVRRDEPQRGDWYLGNLMLMPECRSRGYGRELVEEFVDYVRGLDCERILLAATWNNEEGLRFWSNNGFQPLRPIEPTRFGEMIQTGVEMIRFVNM